MGGLGCAAARRRPSRAGAGTARPDHPCPRASASPCRTDGRRRRSRRAARASWSASRTRSRTSTSRARGRSRGGCRPSSAGQDSSGCLGGDVPARDDGTRLVRPRSPCPASTAPTAAALRARRRASRARRGSGSRRAISSSVTSTTSSTCSRATASARSPAKRRVEAVGDRARLDLHALAGLERRVQRGAQPPARRRRRAPGRSAAATPGDQPAAADRDDDRLHVGEVFEDLEPDRALAGQEHRGRRTGGRSTRPVSSTSSSSARAPRPGPDASRSTSAPYPRVAATLSGARAAT